MIENLAKDYSNYMKVDLQCEFRDVQDTIDDMLTRLDEFENLVNMVKTDSELCADISIPVVLQSKEKLNELCNRVDSLEKFVNQVKSDVEIIEMQVVEAEEEMCQNSGKLKNMLKPLFFNKSPSDVSVQRQNPTSAYVPPKTFSTSSFFPSQSENASSAVEEELM